MGKTKNPELEPEQIVDDEPIIVKGPLRDEPEPAYSPAWEVVNDRQNILADKIPPKIYSLEALMAAGIVTEEMLTDGGYVKNTDYATANTAGVVKTSTTFMTQVTTAGVLAGNTASVAQYNSGSANMFISKGTLEAVFYNLLIGKLIEATPIWDTAVTGTIFSFTLVKDENGGGHLEYTATTPTPTPTP